MFATVVTKLKNIARGGIVGDLWLYTYRALKPRRGVHGVRTALSPTQVLSDPARSIFFGYHDKSPFSADGSRLLATSVAAPEARLDSECAPMALGYYRREDRGLFGDSFVQFAETRVWSWQQGCMLQWLPTAPNTQVMFNTVVGRQLGSALLDVNTGEVSQEFKSPIFALDPRGSYAITLNLSRLARLRDGYGCSLIPDSSANEAAPDDDGLFLFDLDGGDRNLVISLRELAGDIGAAHAEHYVNHATASPDGRHIAFFHVWRFPDSTRAMRFFVYECATNQLKCIEAESTISHYCWIDGSTLIATARKPGNALWSYLLYEIGSTVECRDSCVPLRTDGHPMRSPNSDQIFVADLRMTRRRDDSVVLFNLKGEVLEVARFCLPFRFSGPVRCDLHPRWDRRGDEVCVDMVYRGRRAMCVVDVKQAVRTLT